jgi:Protein of unknown function (DUF4013)
MDNIAETLTWPFRDPLWLPKTFVQALILLVPVVGAIAMLGWMLKSLDNLRAGRDELAPGSFHLSRGWPLFAVEVVYYAVISIVGLALSIAGGGHRGLFAIAQLWNVLASLGFAFIFPALVLTVYRGGFAAGLDLGAVIHLSWINPRASLGAALICILAGAVGLVGLAACIVGVVFTEAYASAVIVAAVAWFERQLAGQPSTT